MYILKMFSSNPVLTTNQTGYGYAQFHGQIKIDFLLLKNFQIETENCKSLYG